MLAVFNAPDRGKMRHRVVFKAVVLALTVSILALLSIAPAWSNNEQAKASWTDIVGCEYTVTTSWSKKLPVNSITIDLYRNGVFLQSVLDSSENVTSPYSTTFYLWQPGRGDADYHAVVKIHSDHFSTLIDTAVTPTVSVRGCGF